jgi:hypothetical protein
MHNSTQPSGTTVGQGTNTSDDVEVFFVASSASEASKKEKASRAQRNAFIKRKQARLRSNSQAQAARRQDDGSTKSHDLKVNERPQTSEPEQDHRNAMVATRTCLDTNRLDPFHQSKVEITPEMQSLFTWYFSVVLPVVEPTQLEQEDYSRWTIPMLYAEPALLFSLLACMAHDVEQATVSGFGPPSRRNMTAERLHYKYQATRGINEALADSHAALKPSTLLAVHYLLWQEVSWSTLFPEQH